MSVETPRIPAPARKIFISQLQSVKVVPSPERAKHNDQNLYGKFVLNLGGGKCFYLTNVWIQGTIKDILHDNDKKTIVRLHDGTGVADVFGIEEIVSRNWFLEKSFNKGMQVMVTGMILQTGNRVPCIQAFRISELHGCTMDDWNSQVEKLQNYLVLKTKENVR